MIKKQTEGGFFSHLVELRRRLIHSLIFLSILFVICYYFSEYIYGFLVDPYAQAVKDADREAARLEAYDPYERFGYLGSGLTGMLGGYPGQYQSQVTPNPTPLQSALGIGSTLAGIYGDYGGFRQK